MLKLIKNQNNVTENNETILEITKPLSPIEKSIIDIMLQGNDYQYTIDDKSTPILILHNNGTDVSGTIDDINGMLDTWYAKFTIGTRHQQGKIKMITVAPILTIYDLFEILHGAALYLSRKYNRRIELSSKGHNTLYLRVNFIVKLTVSYYKLDNSFKVFIQDVNPDIATDFDIYNEYCEMMLKILRLTATRCTSLSEI